MHRILFQSRSNCLKLTSTSYPSLSSLSSLSSTSSSLLQRKHKHTTTYPSTLTQRLFSTGRHGKLIYPAGPQDRPQKRDQNESKDSVDKSSPEEPYTGKMIGGLPEAEFKKRWEASFQKMESFYSGAGFGAQYSETVNEWESDVTNPTLSLCVCVCVCVSLCVCVSPSLITVLNKSFISVGLLQRSHSPSPHLTISFAFPHINT